MTGDEQLLVELDELFGRIDPPPAGMVEQAQRAVRSQLVEALTQGTVVLESRRALDEPFAPLVTTAAGDEERHRQLVRACLDGNAQARWTKFRITYHPPTSGTGRPPVRPVPDQPSAPPASRGTGGAGSQDAAVPAYGRTAPRPAGNPGHGAADGRPGRWAGAAAQTSGTRSSRCGVRGEAAGARPGRELAGALLQAFLYGTALYVLVLLGLVLMSSLAGHFHHS